MQSPKVKVLLCYPADFSDLQRVPVWFAAVPRVGDWLQWGVAPKRVIGVEWCGDDHEPECVCVPVVYLEHAPYKEHPKNNPAWAGKGEDGD